MKILLTGNMGYVGPAVTAHLRRVFPDATLVGVDAGWFAHCLTTRTALPEAALDVQRFRIDLGSHAIVEAFGDDLEAARSVPQEARDADGAATGQGGERLVFPSALFGDDHWVFGQAPYSEWRDAALAAGAEPTGDPPPDIPAALSRFGRMAGPEVEAVCELAGPRASAELWGLAVEWRVKPIRVLTGMLWELPSS
jgi:hypothetical protein